jgi:type III secretion protein J
VVKNENMYAILVNENDQIQALSVLNANGQPQISYTNIGEVFKKDSFISSPLEEEARFIFALDQEISSMLMQFDGVVDVKVDVSLPRVTESLWKKDSAEPSASVIVKYKPEYKINLYLNRIKQLVANAVPGLSATNVEVLIVPISGID